MKFSFLVPAYKGTYLQEALHSMLSQTFDDFQILISDDNSPENLAAIVNSFNSDKIIYNRNKSNIGGEFLTKHWNLLLELCNSDYLIIASDDDIYDSNFLREIYTLTQKHPEVDVIRARTQRINDIGEITSKEDIFEEYQTELEVVYSIFCCNYIGCIGNYVFKTSALKRNGGFVNLPYAWFSDILSVISTAKNGQLNTKNILFSFRLSHMNISDTSKNIAIDKRKLKATILFHKLMGEYMKGLKIDNSTLSNNMYNAIIKAYTHRAYSQVGDYSWSIHIWKWKSIYNALNKNFYFSKYSFFKYFCIAIINRFFFKIINK